MNIFSFDDVHALFCVISFMMSSLFACLLSVQDYDEPSSDNIRDGKPTVTFSESIDENGGIEVSEAAFQSNRDENYLGPSGHDFDARKFSAASVDILIGKF